MSEPANQITEFESALLERASDYDLSISADAIQQLTAYYQLINRWNPRLHLVAPCSAADFAQRHILESLVLLRYLPESATVIDVGSGAGLPIIPCLIVRPNISAVLIESNKRKSVFLREALQSIAASSAKVIAERFETNKAPDAGFVTSRALDRFVSLVPTLIEWAPSGSKLLLFGGKELERALTEPHTKVQIPNSERRFLFVINKERA